MEQRELGNSGLYTSAIGFGTWEMSTTQYGALDVNEASIAVNSAIEIQKKIRKRNKQSKHIDRFEVRIGLHMGKFVVKDDDLFGVVVFQSEFGELFTKRPCTPSN